MESVYESTLAVDAHMIRDLLERAGIPTRVEGATGRVVKREQYTADRITASEIDADGDGRFERPVSYDDLEEPRPR